jgi:hypothetical protein
MYLPDKTVIDTGSSLITVDFVEHRSKSVACICYVNNISVKCSDLSLPRLRERFAACIIMAADAALDSSAHVELLSRLHEVFAEGGDR